MIVEQCSSHSKRALGIRKGWIGTRTHDTTAPILIDMARAKAQVEVESRGIGVDRCVIGACGWQLDRLRTSVVSVKRVMLMMMMVKGRI